MTTTKASTIDPRVKYLEGVVKTPGATAYAQANAAGFSDPGAGAIRRGYEWLQKQGYIKAKTKKGDKRNVSLWFITPKGTLWLNQQNQTKEPPATKPNNSKPVAAKKPAPNKIVDEEQVFQALQRTGRQWSTVQQLMDELSATKNSVAQNLFKLVDQRRVSTEARENNVFYYRITPATTIKVVTPVGSENISSPAPFTGSSDLYGQMSSLVEQIRSTSVSKDELRGLARTMRDITHSMTEFTQRLEAMS